MRCRFIREIGTRAVLRVYWSSEIVVALEPCDECKTTHPMGEPIKDCGTPASYHHEVCVPLADTERLEAFNAFGEASAIDPARWPTCCSTCGAVVPAEETMREPEGGWKIGHTRVKVYRQISTSRLYESASGRPEPGDVHYSTQHAPNERCYSGWTNCDGRHLNVVLPNGHTWDIDSRASNCTLRDDNEHRCWTRTGSAEAGTLDVGKSGRTCAAGAGSIQQGQYHGFLRNFELIPA